MAWCPICKSEYREGFTICADCKVELVDALEQIEMIPLCTFEDEDIAEKFSAYLKYAEIEHSIDKKNENITILTDKNSFHKGVMSVLAFTKLEENLYAAKNIDSSYFIGSTSKMLDEASNSYNENFDAPIDENEDSDDDTDYSTQNSRNFTPQESVIYESNSTKADESYTTGLMLLVFGIMGLVYLAFFSKNVSLSFSNIVIIVIFAAMVIYAIFSLKASANYRKAAVKEKETVDNIQDWLLSNISKEDILAQDMPAESPEDNYFRRIEYVKEKLNGEFPDLNDNFADMLIDEFYETIFED